MTVRRRTHGLRRVGLIGACLAALAVGLVHAEGQGPAARRPAATAPRPAAPKTPPSTPPARPASNPADAQVDAAAVTAAIDSLGKLDYRTRVEASATVRRAAPVVALPLLTAAAKGHADGYVRFRALVLLAGFNDPQSTPVFVAALSDENDRLREVAYAFVEEHPQPALVPRLLQALEKEEAEFVRPALVRALAAHGADPRVQAVLTREVMRGVDFFRAAVIEALGAHKATYALKSLAALAQQDGPLQDDAVRALGQIGDAAMLPVLAGVQRAASRELQPTVAAAICRLGSNCEGHTRFVRESLAFAARHIGYQELARSSSLALADLASAGRSDAMTALFELGMPANEPVRAPIALAAGRAAMSAPALLLDVLPGLPTKEATLLLRDAFDMLEEDYFEERFFATVRRTYWNSPQDAPSRASAQVLITALEF